MMYPCTKKTVNDCRTVIVTFTAPNTGKVVYCTDDEYKVGEVLNFWLESAFTPISLLGSEIEIARQRKYKDPSRAVMDCLAEIEQVIKDHREEKVQ